MYNSQYYTCEQIDERLLQGYVDDYNTKHSTNLTKDQFLTLLGSMFNKEFISQTKGSSTSAVMSQKEVTDELNKIEMDLLGEFLYRNSAGRYKNYITNNDEIISNENYEHYIIDYCFAKPGVIVRNAWILNGSHKYCWFYNANFELIGYLTDDSITNTSKLLELTAENIPEGAKYFRCNLLKGAITDFTGLISFNRKVKVEQSIKNDALSVPSNAAVNTMKTNLENSINSSVTSANNSRILDSIYVNYGFLKDDGITIYPYQTKFGHSVFLEAVPCKVTAAYIFGAMTEKKYCWFYDSHLNVVGSLADTSIVDGEKELVLTAENIPSNAKYFRFNILTTHIRSFEGNFKVAKVFEEPLYNQLAEYVAYPFRYLDIDGVTIKIVSGYAHNSVTKYLLAVEGAKLRAYAHPATGLGFTYLWFYNSSGNVIGTMAAEAAGPVEVTLTSENIPEGAMYFRCNLSGWDYPNCHNLIPAEFDNLNNGLTSSAKLNQIIKALYFKDVDFTGITNVRLVKRYNDTNLYFIQLYGSDIDPVYNFGTSTPDKISHSKSGRPAGGECWFQLNWSLLDDGVTGFNISWVSPKLFSECTFAEIYADKNWFSAQDIIMNNIFIGYGDINNDGKNIIPLPNNPTFGHTDYLVAQPCKITNAYIFRNVSSHKYCWFYDDNLDVVGSLEDENIEDGLKELVLTAENIPSGAKYFRCNLNLAVLYHTDGRIRFPNLTDLTIDFERSAISTATKAIESKVIFDNLFNQFKYVDADGWNQYYIDAVTNALVKTTYNHYVIDYCYAIPGVVIDKAWVINNASGKYCWFYDKNLNIVGYLTDTAHINGETLLELTAENIPEGAVYFRCNLLADRCKRYKNLIPMPPSVIFNRTIDYPVFNPPTIYGRTIQSNTFLRVNNSVYPEGCLRDIRKLNIDGGIESPLVSNSNGAGTLNLTRQVTDEFGNTKNVSIKVKLKDLSTLPSTKHFVLCIGESTTSATQRNPYTGQYDGCWCWPSAMQMYNMMDKKDGVATEIVTIGTLGNINAQFTYKSENFINKSFHEGRGGWPSYAMLNWPCQAKFGSYTNIFSGSTLWYALGLATKTPYSQSSYNVDSESWANTPAQRALVTQTKLGTYKVDGNSALWNQVKALSGGSYPTFAGTGDYTGSSTQIAQLQDWFDSLMANPLNPFYDIDRARNSNYKTAFNLDKYLERYRTCDDLGVTLTGSAGQTVTGSDGNTYTIGTKVTNTSAYIVCSPTHVVLNVGINDSEGGNASENTLENIKDFMSLFSVPVAYFLTRPAGVCNPGLWADRVICNQYTYNSFVPKHNVPLLQSLDEWAETQNDKYVLAAYHVQYPAATSQEFLENEEPYPVQRVNANRGDVHTGYWGYRSVGLQVLHWLYNIIS